MLSVINTARKQVAVHWPKGDKPDRHGMETYGTPVEIMVRWSFGTKIQLQTQKETGETYSATVLLGVDVKEGDYLMLGSLSTELDQAVPKNNPGAYLVRRFRKTPSLRNDQFVRRAFV